MPHDERDRRRRAKAREPLEARYRATALDKYLDGGGGADPVGEIACRPYRPGDEVSALDCFNETFGLDRTLDYWRWKFAPPGATQHIAVAADEAGTVHAFWGAVPAIWQYDGREKRNGMIADVYCRRHPALIRSGLFVKLFNMFIDRFVASGELSLIQGFAGPVATRIYDLDGILFAKKALSVLRRPVRRWRPVATLGGGKLRVERGTAAVAQAGRLWSEVAGRYPRAQIRDAAWAQHRFVDRPDAGYEIGAALDGAGRPRAWWATRAMDDRLVLCDLLWDGDAHVLAFVEREIDRAARGAGARTCEALLANDLVATTLMKAAGWQAVRHPERMFWLMVTRDPVYPGDVMDRVYLTYADTDQV